MQIQNQSLWHITQGQRDKYLLAVIATSGSALLLFMPPLIARYAIDVTLSGELAAAAPPLAALQQYLGIHSIQGYLWLSAAAALVLTLIGGVCLFLRGRWAALASENIARRTREALFWRLHHLQAEFFDRADTGDLIQRYSSDVETLRVFLSSDVVEIGRALILLLVLVPILFWMDTRLAWASLCLMPILLAFAIAFFTKVKQVFLLTDEAEGEMTAMLQENLTGIRVVRAFARQEFEMQKFARHNAAFRDQNNVLIRWMGLYWSTSECLSLVQLGIVLLVGAHLIIVDAISVGVLFAFLTSVAMVLWPIRQMGRVLTDTGKAVVALERINEILHEPEESTDAVPAQPRAQGQLSIRHLHFAYEPGQPLLQDFNLEIEAGETLAIVGPPGAGKSSLIRLLLRLYQPQQGQILLDGVDIQLLNRQWLRQQFGVVLQDPFLYSRSVAENLRIGRPEAADYELEYACLDAAIHESIQAMPQGYDALVGERGVTLSGGQRQRLALARALLKDPPILVLDDSLSAVDTATEQQILAALRERKGRHTTLIIAHRLSSVMHADRILVLEQGRIVQLGTHAQLRAQPGPYQRLCAIQGALDWEIARDMQLQDAD